MADSPRQLIFDIGKAYNSLSNQQKQTITDCGASTLVELLEKAAMAQMLKSYDDYCK